MSAQEDLRRIDLAIGPSKALQSSHPTILHILQTRDLAGIQKSVAKVDESLEMYKELALAHRRGKWFQWTNHISLQT